MKAKRKPGLGMATDRDRNKLVIFKATLKGSNNSPHLQVIALNNWGNKSLRFDDSKPVFSFKKPSTYLIMKGGKL